MSTQHETAKKKWFPVATLLDELTAMAIVVAMVAAIWKMDGWLFLAATATKALWSISCVMARRSIVDGTYDAFLAIITKRDAK